MLKKRAILLFKQFPEVVDIRVEDVKKFPKWADDSENGKCTYIKLEVEGRTRWVWHHKERKK